MSFNGSGSFTPLPANYPAVANTLITAANRNALDSDFANGLSNCITKDGQQTVIANIPFSGFKLTAIGAATARTDAASMATIQDGTGVYVATVGGTADVITLTPSPAITGYVAGQEFWWIASGTNTTNVTVNASGLGAKAFTKNGSTPLVAGDIPIGMLVGGKYDGTRFQLISSDNATYLSLIAGGTVSGATTFGSTVTLNADPNTALQAVPIQDLRSYLAGLMLSTVGASTTMTIAVGAALDSTNVAMMRLLASTGKTTSAWAVGSGNGGLDTGVIANNTFYKFYLIKRTDTNVVDVIFTIAALATGPAMPANYTLFRYIGSGLTDGAGKWTAFIQDGDLFQWLVPVNNVNTTNPGTLAVTATLAVPTGLNVLAWINAAENNITSNTPILYLSDLATTDSISTTFASLIGSAAAASSWMSADFYIRTNTTQQIRYRINPSGVSDLVRINTLGWIDHRGRDN